MQQPMTRFLLATLMAAGQAFAQSQSDVIQPTPNLRAEGIPPIPAALAKKIGLYTEFRPKGFVGWHPLRREMMVGARPANTTQIHRLAAPMGKLEQLTDFADPVRSARFERRRGDYLVFAKDTGGSEATQLYRLDFGTGKSTRLTSPDSLHRGGEWNNAGDRLVLSSTQLDKTGKRDSVTTELALLDPLTGTTQTVASLPGNWGGFRFSPDDKRLLALHFLSNTLTELWEISVAGGARVRLLGSAAGPAVAYSDADYTPDGKGVVLSSNEGGEFRQLIHLDLQSRTRTVLSRDIAWDVNHIAVSRRTGITAVITNEAGKGVLRLFDIAGRKELPQPKLPSGMVTGAEWHDNGVDLAFNLQSAQLAGDVYSLDVRTGVVTRWTETSVEGIDTVQFREPESIAWNSFDGLKITGFLYRPGSRHSGRRPVIINIHGGPESQARPGFQGRSQYFVHDLGIAMIYPNVRGSSGFGKTFQSLDDGVKREDSVKDIGALLDWIATQPDLDPKRVMVMGGSYGGYMSLAVATHYPDRIAGSIDVVGISNFQTFLERTETYRRDNRRAEYGDERDPAMRAFFERISPLTHADKIAKPLFVVQGRNDPRVPWQEADQIVARVRLSKTPVWYLLAEDEGHGFAKKNNADFLFYSMVRFAEEVLLK
ncbi:MAG: prolyl oligopeptidase family serine peptidase [Betaproteobacteria bacterium]